MTAINARAASTIETDWIMAEELDEAIRPICSAFIARVWLRYCARTA
jgi:hypothetical protein